MGVTWLKLPWRCSRSCCFCRLLVWFHHIAHRGTDRLQSSAQKVSQFGCCEASTPIARRIEFGTYDVGQTLESHKTVSGIQHSRTHGTKCLTTSACSTASSLESIATITTSMRTAVSSSSAANQPNL